MKILVVDDTRIILSVVEAILARDQQEIFTASDGREGLGVFGDIRPDMVITDIEMPWQDGLSMMQAIRRIDPTVVTVYMTGNPGPYQHRLEQEAQTYAAGILYKPFTRSELLRSVREVAALASPGRNALRSLMAPGCLGPSAAPPVKQGVASLSCASFQRECRYTKIDRGFADGRLSRPI